jgi:hypothetical protein
MIRTVRLAHSATSGRASVIGIAYHSNTRSNEEVEMVLTHEVATVWWEQGVPDRMVWRERRWRVSDTPTRLTATAEFLPSAMTHAPERTVGWRFQVSAGDEAVVVDITPDGDGWVVARTWR